uniref:probable carboxylesterase 12 n=1 Tax=Erigeron canadensis TaxID=72917 RepID=UPI001CB98C2E|nr:probable carboxylesterase 12 [Erigeron canadensis]
MSFSFAPIPLPNPSEILHDLSPFILIHKNGRIERLVGEEVLPPGTDESTGVCSKDILVSEETGLSARIYLPGTTAGEKQKVPVLIYFHGGGFVAGTASSAFFQPFLNKLALQANIIIVSIDYRNAPEHTFPAPFDDSWTAFKWVASHASGEGNEPWLNEHADFKKVFCGGESAGATICHHLGIRIGLEKAVDTFDQDGIKLGGIVLIHPYFWGETLIGDEVIADMTQTNLLGNLWRVGYPLANGLDDPIINPGLDPNLSKLGCKRVLVCVAEKDLLRDRGWKYYEDLRKSDWDGQVDMLEAKGEGHAFHLFTPFCENAVNLFKALSLFINGDK